MALCNRSLARLSSGDCEGALNDAEEALEVLAEHLDGDGGGLHTDAASDPTGKSHTANTCHRDVPHIVIQESSTSLIAALAWYRKVSTVSHDTKRGIDSSLPESNIYCVEYTPANEQGDDLLVTGSRPASA